MWYSRTLPGTRLHAKLACIEARLHLISVPKLPLFPSNIRNQYVVPQYMLCFLQPVGPRWHLILLHFWRCIRLCPQVRMHLGRHLGYAGYSIHQATWTPTCPWKMHRTAICTICCYSTDLIQSISKFHFIYPMYCANIHITPCCWSSYFW